MKNLILFSFLFLLSAVQAQVLKDFTIPDSYQKILEVKGDLDKDGKYETVILFKTDKKTHSDFNNGYQHEFFILKNINGKQKVWQKNSTVIFAGETGFYPEYNPQPEFTIKNNCLIISQQFNTNSRHTQNYKNTFRFQNGDFYLIGSVSQFDDTCEFNILNEINFSTGKVIIDEQYYPCFKGDQPPAENFYKEFIQKNKTLIKMNTFTPGENSIKIPNSDKYYNF